MTIRDLLDEAIIPECTLICIEDTSGDCKFCGPRCDYKPKQDYIVRAIYPEAYGKFYGQHGLTILV